MPTTYIRFSRLGSRSEAADYLFSLSFRVYIRLKISKFYFSAQPPISSTISIVLLRFSFASSANAVTFAWVHPRFTQDLMGSFLGLTQLH